MFVRVFVRLMMKPYGLIITGDTEKARCYKKTLGEVGFQVQSVTTGARAQVQLTFTTPDLIVLDLQLPDIPGEVVLRQIKACPRLKKTRLYLVPSDHSQNDAAQRATQHALESEMSAVDIASLAALVRNHKIPV
jgi:DNA-binding response OmpR family regulator